MRPIALVLACLTPAAWAGEDLGEVPAQVAGLDRVSRAIGVPILVRTADLRVDTPFGPITARPAGEGLEAFGTVLAEELSIYPKAVMERSRLRRIVLASELAFDGQLRGAIPDYGGDALYYDVARGSHSRSYQRAAIHHEFFHVVDYRDDGQVYRDDAWSALNPKGFRYGPGGRNVQEDALGSLFADDVPGFLTRYAASGVEEDKAEVFSRLIVAPREVARRAAADPILARKVARMKSLMKSFEPAVDDAFWKRVEGRDQPPPARP
ncbi:MAG: hypothetical protein BGO49_18835 [Planctomycetales bacterium 71-10]|nr:MAG: hypothetical protein BGO49_18835 [Planctomycetales bacterium 71-10]